jgi:hypothetical protein
MASRIDSRPFPDEGPIMRISRFRIRTLMFLVWLGALVSLGAVDLYREQAGHWVEFGDIRLGPDGDPRAAFVWQQTNYHVWGIPLGPSLTAIFCGILVIASVLVWTILRMRKRSTSPHLAGTDV